jgi:hypothetical protein
LPVRVTLVGWHLDDHLLDEQAVLARDVTLTGWADALVSD